MIQREYIRQGALVLGGICVGAGTTYLLVEKRIRKEYRELAEEEIESVKQAYKMLYKQGEFSTPESAAKALASTSKDEEKTPEQIGMEAVRKLIKTQGYSPEEEALNELRVVDEPVQPSKSDLTQVVRNVFTDASVIEPSATEPYIISIEEYAEEFRNHEKVTVTYYEGDETLADENDEMIHDIESNVGLDNVTRFGQGGSQDENVVYVRNQRTGIDFEICRMTVGYSEHVLGLPPEDNQGAGFVKNRPREIRDDD